ncbi:MAG: FtsW/RodA/SpoVE family cell cycle protein [Eubacteriales bacterium]|nr:FtsW/RodA/SpoVE family cell cycle protein [Eubacteriales bacterium]
MLSDYLLKLTQFAVIILSAAILLRCFRSLLQEKTDRETSAYLRVGKENVPIEHWENLIGRSRSADIRLFGDGIGKLHAILRRSDRGIWSVYDIFSKGGVWVNGMRVPAYGMKLRTGDIINLGGSCVRFIYMNEEQREETEEERFEAGISVSPTVTLIELVLFQVLLFIEHTFTADRQHIGMIALAYGTLIVLEVCVYEAMRVIDRMGFEIEILAFYLTTIGVAVSASSTPEDMDKQILLIIASVMLFIAGGWWLRSLRLTTSMRIPFAMLSLGMLAVNILTADRINGAKNWLEFGGFSFQPSELVKVFYIYVGASTLDMLYRKKNLFSFIVYSAICVVALALIGDFGTALIFFATFLVISFMRSGSIATVLLAVTGAVLAAVLAITVKPYIAQRFAIWGHAWDDVFDSGYQQTRAMSAAASGGLIGKGAGAGWLKTIVASNTDMVFAYVCEELGLIVGICSVAAVLMMAFFAIRMAKNGRSAYYGIAACATSSMLLVQLALNVFGSVDMLPFTGVTFPFVSRGGSSLISCWMLMAYLKSTDTRLGASFAVKPLEVDDEFSPQLFSRFDDPDEENDNDSYDEEVHRIGKKRLQRTKRGIRGDESRSRRQENGFRLSNDGIRQHEKALRADRNDYRSGHRVQRQEKDFRRTARYSDEYDDFYDERSWKNTYREEDDR